MRNRFLALVLLLVPLGPLAGCSALPGQGPPPRLFTLSPKTTFTDTVIGARRVDWQLMIETPYAAQSLNAPRIALMTSPMQVDQYARANWVDRAPVLVQDMLVQSFDSTRKIVAVGREGLSLRPDYVLRTELRDFQGEVAGPNKHTIRVRLNARLVRMPQRMITANEDFEATWDVNPEKMEDVISGFDEALGKVLKRLVEWTLLQAETDWRSRERRS